MYYEIYDILVNNLYGVGVELTNYQDMVITVLSTLGCVAVVVLPFALCICMIKAFWGNY